MIIFKTLILRDARDNILDIIELDAGATPATIEDLKRRPGVARLETITSMDIGVRHDETTNQ